MLWFFHVPHTGGRALGRYLWSNHSGQYKKLHNSEDIRECTAAVESGVEKTETIIKYFILRDPIERGYKEFLHYSNNLTQIGQVNHLNLENLKQTNPNFDHTDPVAYFSLEVNRNVYCKFLLERTDFSQPVTDRDLHIILNKFLPSSSTTTDKSDQEFYYDLFTDLQTGSMPVLEKILGTTITLPTPRQLHNKQPNEERVKVPDDIRKTIVERNIYDVQLFSFLCQT